MQHGIRLQFSVPIVHQFFDFNIMVASVKPLVELPKCLPEFDFLMNLQFVVDVYGLNWWCEQLIVQSLDVLLRVGDLILRYVPFDFVP